MTQKVYSVDEMEEMIKNERPINPNELDPRKLENFIHKYTHKVERNKIN